MDEHNFSGYIEELIEQKYEQWKGRRQKMRVKDLDIHDDVRIIFITQAGSVHKEKAQMIDYTLNEEQLSEYLLNALMIKMRPEIESDRMRYYAQVGEQGREQEAMEMSLFSSNSIEVIYDKWMQLDAVKEQREITELSIKKIEQ